MNFTYKIIKNAISKEQASFIYDYFLLKNIKLLKVRALNYL